ncbi:hypothetical protein FHX78_116934 [Streptomyces capillispiralis]|uniref:Uncharacterized protein n=1 Tax=Streptomyces capillispiralis TaxID=68182 RepID=A0A561TS07_9ACTN|nr:hypothetical protein FHX78_116934 [Streptomyces capillispiralis]
MRRCPNRRVSSGVRREPSTPPRHGSPRASPYCHGARPSSSSIRTAISGEAIMTDPPKSRALRNNGRSPGCRRRYCQPAAMSRPGREVAARAGGAGSGCRMRRMPSADPKKDSASTTMVAAAPSAPIRSPPTSGPALTQIQLVVSNRLLARRRCSGGTSAFRCAPLAASNATEAAVWRTPTTHSWLKVSRSNAMATGMLTSVTQRARSAVIMTGRLYWCSIRTPSGRAITALAIADNAASTETCNAEESSTRRAISGNAPMPTALPAALTA